MKKIIEGKVFVLGDDIDTDQIIPAKHLIYNPAIPSERKMYGALALSGVPEDQSGLPRGHVPFVRKGQEKSQFNIIVAGKNFGCGSSREHAPVALQAAGVEVVLAQSYARIFYRNAVNGNYVVPCEMPIRLCDTIKTGDVMRVDLENNTAQDTSTGSVFPLNPLGDIFPILEAGGIFEYAKKAGMIVVAPFMGQRKGLPDESGDYKFRKGFYR